MGMKSTLEITYTHTHIYMCVCMCICVERDLYIHVLPSINTELVCHLSQIPSSSCNIKGAFEILSALQVLTNNMKACFLPASLETLVVNVCKISIMQFAVLHN